MNTQAISIEDIEEIDAAETEDTSLHIQTGVKAGYGGYSIWDAVNPVNMYKNMAEALGY